MQDENYALHVTFTPVREMAFTKKDKVFKPNTVIFPLKLLIIPRDLILIL